MIRLGPFRVLRVFRGCWPSAPGGETPPLREPFRPWPKQKGLTNAHVHPSGPKFVPVLSCGAYSATPQRSTATFAYTLAASTMSGMVRCRAVVWCLKAVSGLGRSVLCRVGPKVRAGTPNSL